MDAIMHDGHISAACHSPSALRTLARYADPPITLELHTYGSPRVHAETDTADDDRQISAR
jgi:hypothetical protein